MSSNLSIIGEMADELVIDVSTLTGGYDLVGTLEFNPVQIIFDNQSTDTSVEISGNGSSTWRTFPPGEALILDMRANHGIASNMTFPLGKKFYAKGTAGTGNFSISYVYAVS